MTLPDYRGIPIDRPDPCEDDPHSPNCACECRCRWWFLVGIGLLAGILATAIVHRVIA